MRRLPCRSFARSFVVLLAIFGQACSSDTSSDGDRGVGRAGAAGTNASGAAGDAAAGASGTAAQAAGASGFGNAQVDPSAGTMSLTPIAGTEADGTCAQGDANVSPVTPVIWLVVDGSSSMNQPFAAAATRWQTLRETLMSEVGVVATLQSVAKFGLVIYSGGNTDPAMCFRLVTVEPALDNFAAIDAAYPADPIGMGTPTDRALDHVVSTLPVIAVDMLDVKVDPVYVVLATDGQPNDNCGQAGGMVDDATVRQRVIDVVARGTMGGMQMFVISLAGGDRDLQSHLDLVAAATASMTPPFVPATQADLIETFQAIVGGASCQIDLDGEVTMGRECEGMVSLNDQLLACQSEDGFQLTGPSTVQLTGSACMQFLSTQSIVHASFPCDVFSPF